jgi:hypothetical protein
VGLHTPLISRRKPPFRHSSPRTAPGRVVARRDTAERDIFMFT